MVETHLTLEGRSLYHGDSLIDRAFEYSDTKDYINVLKRVYSEKGLKGAIKHEALSTSYLYRCKIDNILALIGCLALFPFEMISNLEAISHLLTQSKKERKYIFNKDLTSGGRLDD